MAPKTGIEGEPEAGGEGVLYERADYPHERTEPLAATEPDPLRGGGPAFALRCGLATLLGITTVGLVMTVIAADTWILGFLGFNEGFWVEFARQSLAAIYVRFSIGGDRFLHGLHLLAWLPIVLTYMTAYQRRALIEHLSAPARAGWALAAAVPFLAVCTPLVALAEHGAVEVDGGSVLFYGTLIAGGGSLIGVFGFAGAVGATLRAALRPLEVAAALLAATVTILIGGLILTNQVPRIGWDLRDVPAGVPQPSLLRLDAGSAFLQNALVSLNYAPASAASALLAEAKGDAVFPKTDERFARLSEAEKARYMRCLFSEDCGAKVRIFDGARDLPPLVFIPVMWIMFLVTWAAVVVAGYSIARLRGAPTPGIAIAWGALAGPIWAVALTFLEAIGSSASVDVASTFYWSLLTATVLGAIGGRLAVRRDEPLGTAPPTR